MSCAIAIHRLLISIVTTLMATLPMMAVASASGFLSTPPDWAVALRSSKAECAKAADHSRLLALASGISPDRIQWLYGRKPFDREGHVSLVIDGWIVIDNGGLGRNLWNASICPGNVCSLDDARRGLEESFLESASIAVRTEVSLGDWSGRVGSAK